jgi:hypothetical protein
MKSAVIIKGNPKFVEGNPDADRFYAELKSFLEELGYQATLDSGEPHTQPKPADVWIAHSRGVDRLRFAPPETITIALGTKGGINHPQDKSLKKGDVPDKYHYILTDEMREAIKKHLQ